MVKAVDSGWRFQCKYARKLSHQVAAVLADFYQQSSCAWIEDAIAEGRRDHSQGESGEPSPHGVDCRVDSNHFPTVFAFKPAGQIARIVYVIRDFAGLEVDTLAG